MDEEAPAPPPEESIPEAQESAPSADVERVLKLEPEVEADVRKRTTLYDEVRRLGRTQKILLALRGGMESRLVLLKSYDPMIYFYLCKNPKITSEEIVEIAKSDLMTPNTAEIITRNKEWMKNERVRFHLAMNRKTPQALALHVLGLLGNRSLREIARNVSAPPALRRLALKRLQGIPEDQTR